MQRREMVTVSGKKEGFKLINHGQDILPASHPGAMNDAEPAVWHKFLILAHILYILKNDFLSFTIFGSSNDAGSPRGANSKKIPKNNATGKKLIDCKFHSIID